MCLRLPKVAVQKWFAHKESLRCFAGRHNGRAHPDRGPLTGQSSPTAPGPDQGASNLLAKQIICDVICVLALFAMVYGVLLIPEGL